MNPRLLEIILYIAVIIAIYVCGMVYNKRILNLSTIEMIVLFIIIVMIIKRLRY